MRCERGSTLIETMVALVILGVGVLPVIALMGSGYRFQGQARLEVQMATLAETKVEELVTVAGTDLPDTMALVPGGTLESDAPGYSDTAQLDGRVFTRRWQVDLGPAGARDLTVRVIPTQPPSPRTVELSTQLIHD